MLIKRNQLAAALAVAPKDMKTSGNRFQMVGVNLHVSTGGQAYLMATDGVIAFVGRVTDDSMGQASMILPYEAVDAALKLNPKAVYIDCSDGQLGGIQLKLIDAVYPDLQRIIPSSLSGEPAQYHQDQMRQCFKAAALWNGDKTQPFVNHNGRGPGVILVKDAMIVIMPLLTGPNLGVSFFGIAS